MTPPLSSLRPLAIGEIIDRAATFWRQHFRPLFLLSLGFNLLSYCLSKALQLLVQSYNATAREAQSAGNVGLVFGESAKVILLLGVFTVVSLWLYYLNTLAVARYVVADQMGEPVLPAQALQRMLHRVGPLTGAYVLSLLWAMAILLLTLLPGGAVIGMGTALVASGEGASGKLFGVVVMGVGMLVAGLGLLAGMLWYLLRFCLLAPVVAMEDSGAMASFRRSGELLSGRVAPGFSGRVSVRAMLIVTVVSLILLVVGLACGLPAFILRFIYGHPLDPSAPPADIPLSALIPAELLQVVGHAVFAPLGLVVYAMLYLDMRVRREGLDLEQELAAR